MKKQYTSSVNTGLTKKKNVRNVLKSATGCLLGVTAVAGAQAESMTEGWDADVAVLYYNETDRVSALEPAIAIKKTFDDESVVGFKLVLDALTGASANGATASDTPQTFTRPSGNGTYTSDANETPLDDTFRDTRFSFTANYEQPLEDRMNKVVWGANVSSEYDFLSIGGSGTFLHDMNQRNTTLSMGFAFEQDSIKPVGGTPIPLGEMKTAGNKVRTGDENRSMVEMLLGVTQVIDSKTLMQFNYGLAISDGYHNDAYKITSVVDDNGDNVASLDVGSLSNRYLYENRPDSRTKHSVYGKVKRFIGGDVADISYRYMFDDWGVASSTLDMHYRFNMSPSWYIEPHVRFYTQQAADFYNTSLTETQADALVASNGDLTSDYRLGDMDATTLGLKFGFLTPDGNKSSIRVEYYNQTGTASQVIGKQSSQDLVPDVDAVIVQYNYSF
jgi:hypothetical protein